MQKYGVSKLLMQNVPEKRKLNTDFPLLCYPCFDGYDFVIQGFTTREGGVSEGIFATTNLSFSRGDDPERVLENYRRVAAAMGTSIDHIVTSDQTHTTNVRKVGKADCGEGVTRPREHFDVDGMITDEPGVVLATFYADCVPLYFVDPVHRAIGLSHSGWRGTVGRMGARTIEAMSENYGTDAGDLICAIGPSICQSCYEVSEDVALEFKKEFAGHDEIVADGKIQGKYQLDLWRANQVVLMDAGVKEENIQTTEICTCCNPELLFSHRASHGQRGNLGAFLGIKDISN